MYSVKHPHAPICSDPPKRVPADSDIGLDSRYFRLAQKALYGAVCGKKLPIGTLMSCLSFAVFIADPVDPLHHVGLNIRVMRSVW